MPENPGAEDPEPGPDLAGMQDLEALLHASLGLSPGMGDAIRAMTQVHAQWRQAWIETGKFTDDESFELIRIIVAAGAGGLRALD